MCLCESEERERCVRVCMCVRDREIGERESVCCMCERERESECVCLGVCRVCVMWGV